jgi:hypothetical protein
MLRSWTLSSDNVTMIFLLELGLCNQVNFLVPAEVAAVSIWQEVQCFGNALDTLDRWNHDADTSDRSG